MLSSLVLHRWFFRRIVEVAGNWTIEEPFGSKELLPRPDIASLHTHPRQSKYSHLVNPLRHHPHER
jgi:hypothetical protein